MEEASKRLVLSSQTETLVREIEDTDSRVCDGIRTGDGNTVYSVSDDKQVKADAASVEDTVGSVTGEETKDNVDSKQANEECETNSDSAKVIDESTQFRLGKTVEGNSGTVSEVSSGDEICYGEEITNVNQKEENSEVDYATEEQIEMDVKVHCGFDNAAGASVVSTQHVPLAEVDGNDSSVVNEIETDEQRNSVDLATDLSQTIESVDSDNSNSPSDDASTGEVEPLDHNALFDPSFDITNFIDFGVLSCWSGNIQDLKTETGNVSLQEDKIEVATVECERTLESVDATVKAESHDNQSLNAEGIQNDRSETYVSFRAESPSAVTDCPREVSEEDQEDKDHDGLDMIPVYQHDAMREEDGITHEAPSIDPNQKDDAELETANDGTYSDIQTNGVKRKADVLSEDSSEEGRKTVSPEEGRKAFEFEEMGDTYWTDWVIHNGGEEKTPHTEKESYQVVPVELKPAQVQRTRRPYRRRQSQISIPLPASEKPANFNENAPAELIIKFSESDTIPPETSLSKMFKRFGPIRESQTEVDSENNRARVVYRKGSDAEVAYNSAGRINIFGTKTVNYELSYTITETFKVKPDVNATLYLPS